MTIGILVFPGVTQLDFTGPLEVLRRIRDVEVNLVWKHADPVEADSGFWIKPDRALAAVTRLDVIMVPGGAGVNALLGDEEVLDFLRRMAQSAHWVTSVCTGALVLGAAGLLKGYRATTHWASHPFLAELGAIPVRERVVRDGNRITGGGVTAGIDFGLVLAAEIGGREQAEAIQLQLEYDPEPPFQSGNAATASAAAVEEAKRRLAPALARRAEAVAEAARRL